MARFRKLILPLLVVIGVILLVRTVTHSNLSAPNAPEVTANISDLPAAVAGVDRYFATRWEEQGLTPAAAAEELTILRRLSLALHGTIPSLEELRQFEADKRPDRLQHWTQRMLADKRFADYFAERFARGFVGTEGGQFLVFRRDRFVSWLSEQLQEGAPYDAMVREMISSQGLWTSVPSTNFITSAVNMDQLDRNKLAGRSVRAFLGQRMDCAQCHDHPFADWKQDQFAGLAAFYGQVQRTIVVEDRTGEFYMEDVKTGEKRVMPPSVPFGQEWVPAEGSRRDKLAAWITHPENRRFERAVVNRVWGFVFGRPYIDPVDDVPDPGEGTDLLDLLGRDFREHNYDVRRLVMLIVATRPFQMESVHPEEDDEKMARLREEWAVFPLIRLRPEQIIGAVLQAASVRTIDQNSHLFVRFIRFFRENDFIKEYGDLGEEELQDRASTIPQALLRMNGQLIGEVTEGKAMSSLQQISSYAADDSACVEAAYRVVLTRLPTPPETAYFAAQLREKKGDGRAGVVEDLFWSMINSPEFSFNH